MAIRAIFAAFLFVLAQTETSCAVGGSPVPGSGSTSGTATCPIPAAYSVNVSGSGSGSDTSSVQVQPGSSAQDERAGNAPWCNTTELSLAKLNVASAVASNGCPGNNADTTLPCSPDGMLAALEIKPSPINFPTPGSRPRLDYDLVSNPRQEACKEGCTLKVFQLRDPLVAGLANWRYVGDASSIAVGSTTYGRAYISHFSVFALVEVPAPAPLQPGAAAGRFIVESAFIAQEENRTTITVQMTFEEGGIDAPPREIVKGSSRLYQFEQVQPEGGFDDPGCPGTPAETMTCLFPAGTEVNFELGDKNLVSIGRVSDAYRVDFTATVTVL